MFKTTKPLIGTPQDSKSNQRRFEFTPIGYNKINDENRDPRTNTMKRTSTLKPTTIVNQNKNPFNESPLANSVRGGSSFIEPESFDTIHYSDSGRNQKAKVKTSSPIPNGFDNYDLLNNGSNPVKQQQMNASKLQDENYNLKVKIASLTRFLNSITNNEQQEIYQQNSELQEKLIEMRGQISLMTQELAASRTSVKTSGDSRSSNNEVERYKDEIRSLNKVIEELRETNENQNELEKEINKLHQVIDQLETQAAKEKQSSISPAYVDKLEEQLDEVKEKLHDVEFDLNRKNEELDEKDDKIELMEELLKKQKSLSSEKQNHIDDELERLKELVEERESNIISLKNQVNERDALLGREKQKYNKLMEDMKRQLPDIGQESSKLKRIVKDLQNERDEQAELLDQSLSKQAILSNDLRDLRHRLKQYDDKMKHQQNLIQELKVTGASNEKVHNLTAELQSRVKSLEKELNTLSLERDVLQKQLAKSDHEIVALKNNNERTYKAYNELKKNQQERSTKSPKDMDFWKTEIEQLSNQVNNLNVENKRLSKELQGERVLKKLDVNSYDKHEVKSLTTKCNELQMELAEKESSFNQNIIKHQREVEHYKSMIKEREDELRKLSNELRTTKYSTTQQIDEEKLEALKLKSSKEYQVKAMKIELENLKEEHDAEVKSYKKLIERLKIAPSGKVAEEARSKLFTDDQTNELLAKIKDKNNKIRILNNNLTEALSKTNLLEREISKSENVRLSLLNENKRLEKRLDLLTDQLSSQREEAEKLVLRASESSSFELKQELRLKEKQLEASNKEFNDMKHDLIKNYRDIHDEKVLLERKIEKVIRNYRQLQGNVMTGNENEKSTKELLMNKDQAEFFRMKYNKSTYVINDLKFMNSFMLKSIKATNSHIEKDVQNLQKAGIYPDYNLISTKRLSASVLFKFVVAAVRIKRKTEHSGIRNKKLDNLKFKLELQHY